MADIELKVEAEVSDAIRELLNLVRTKKKVAEETNMMTRATDDMGKSWGRAAQNLVSFVGTTGAIYAAVGAVRQMGIELDKIADKQKALGQSENLLTLALANPGREREARERVVSLATQFGNKNFDQVAGVVQTLQALNKGDLDKGMKDAADVLRMGQTGVPLEDALSAVRIGRNMGMTAPQAASRFYLAGVLSQADPATLAKAAPGLINYNDTISGMAIVTALSDIVPGTELKTYTERAATAVNRPTGGAAQLRKLAKRYGFDYENASELDRIAFARQAVGDKMGSLSPEALGKFGFTEELERQSLAILFREGILEKTRGFYGQIGGVGADADLLTPDIARVRGADPVIGFAADAAAKEAAAESRAIQGPLGAISRQRDRRLTQGAEGLIGTTAEPYFVDEKGRLQGFPAMLSDISAFFSPPNMAYEEERYRGRTDLSRAEWEEANPRKQGGASMTEETAQKLIDAIDKNTGATDKNTMTTTASPTPATRQPVRNASEGM